MTVWMNIVTPEYFERMHIGIARGRTFDDRDIAAVIVNEELAKRIGIGEKSLAKGEVEIKPRNGAMIAAKPEEAVEKILQLIKASMPGAK